mmetsp:Transcript_24884/g.57959  ORF Transcript_24884/g.57959 Transcript_24884/m.57959 type:complete len:305 (-) Transcript_24884:394-1308(-)|eukprot:CAMPEP_0116844148 /NCGR_PEP_ID=MMETSP0418-20121206/12502_1 /TAXON_ID=1158023 /ORGANISM="Astrosyne radiata, Strain 13vi08-1A" /LENGTH=304 /DNA_ID=CAMNT_0004475019 /DNA_START=312 /DNA_END=1226 /DNA_ORIENTATION=-
MNIPCFHRKEITLGPLLEYGSRRTKLYSIDKVNLQHTDDNYSNPLKREVSESPHRFVAMLVSDDTAEEAQMISSFRHDHIARVHGIYSTRSNVLLIVEKMMYTLAECLEEWAARVTPPPLSERLRVAHDLSVVLYYLHERQICIRDIHPEAIGFDMQGTLKLYDFSRAKKLENIKGDRRGADEKDCDETVNEEYSAPEVVTGKSFGLAADVFSFVMVLWELLMLFPACAEEAEEYRAKIQSSNWPMWAKEMIESGLHPDATKRPKMKLLQRCLRIILKEEGAKERARSKRSQKQHGKRVQRIEI